jgi:hypothetical protein
MKLALVVLATMPFSFSACKSSPPGGPEMTQPAMHATMAGQAHGPGMMSAPAMAGTGNTAPAMAGGAMAGGSIMAAHAVAPAAAVMAHAPATAPAMVPAAMAPATTMGATSKPTMKTAGGKRPVAGTRL